MAACLEKSAGKLLTFIMTSKLERERSLSFSLVVKYVFLRSGHICMKEWSQECTTRQGLERVHANSHSEWHRYM